MRFCKIFKENLDTAELPVLRKYHDPQYLRWYRYRGFNFRYRTTL